MREGVAPPVVHCCIFYCFIIVYCVEECKEKLPYLQNPQISATFQLVYVKCMKKFDFSIFSIDFGVDLFYNTS